MFKVVYNSMRPESKPSDSDLQNISSRDCYEGFNS